MTRSILKNPNSVFPSSYPMLNDYSLVPISGLQFWYDFSDGAGSTVTDLSGNGNNGTLTNCTWNAHGISLDGTNDYVSTPVVGTLEYERLILTKVDITGVTYQAIIGDLDQPGNKGSQILGLNASPLVFNGYASVNGTFAADGTTFATDNLTEWHSLSASRQGILAASTHTIQSMNVGGYSQAGPYAYVVSTNVIRIGEYGVINGSQRLKGEVAAALGYNRVLTNNERGKVEAYFERLAILRGLYIAVTALVSGIAWCSRFPTSRAINDLIQPFAGNVVAFIAALHAAGAAVTVNATYRPPERAYLMHWCWAIAVGDIAPAAVPTISGVEIDWTHDGDMEAARTAAILMKHEFDMVHQAELVSRHTQHRAIDMTIQFKGAISVRTRAGAMAAVACQSDLVPVGRSYGVNKLTTDQPHWSDDGH